MLIEMCDGPRRAALKELKSKNFTTEDTEHSEVLIDFLRGLCGLCGEKHLRNNLLLPGQFAYIHIAAADDNADFQSAQIDFLFPQHANRHRGRWLDDDLRTFPHEFHRCNDARFADGDDLLNVLLNDGEGQISK
jgi:hypothetical protein